MELINKNADTISSWYRSKLQIVNQIEPYNYQYKFYDEIGEQYIDVLGLSELKTLEIYLKSIIGENMMGRIMGDGNDDERMDYADYLVAVGQDFADSLNEKEYNIFYTIVRFIVECLRDKDCKDTEMAIAELEI